MTTAQETNPSVSAVAISVMAERDRQLHHLNGVSLNPYSTVSMRWLWQKGWDGVRPTDLVDGSWNWAVWLRGHVAKQLDDADERKQTSLVANATERLNEESATLDIPTP